MAKPASNPLASEFTKADSPYRNRIIGASVGLPGSGTTTFWLGAPGPIVVFSLNLGLEGVIERFQDEKDIYVKEYEWAPSSDNIDDVDDELQNQAIELRNQFEKDFEVALAHARTVIIDKETELWELYRYAENGKPKDTPLNYATLNQRYRKLLNAPKRTDINFGVIQGMKEAWDKKVNPRNGVVGAVNSGRWERAGFKEVEGLVHINLYHAWKKGEGGAEYTVEIGKSRGPGGQTIQGMTLTGDDVNFKTVGQMMFPESNEEDWV